MEETNFKEKIVFKVCPYIFNHQKFLAKYLKLYNDLQNNFFGNGNDEYFLKDWISNIKLGKYIVMDRVESAIGENNSSDCKHLRFRSFTNKKIIYDKNIVIEYLYGEWSFNEKVDLIKAFVMTANALIREECVTGYIETEVEITSDDDMK